MGREASELAFPRGSVGTMPGTMPGENGVIDPYSYSIRFDSILRDPSIGSWFRHHDPFEYEYRCTEYEYDCSEELL